MTVVFMLGPWWLLHEFGKKQSTVGYWVTFIFLGLFYSLSLTASEVESVDIWRFAIFIPVHLGCLCYGRIEKLLFWWKP
jgi:multisubunit Na+/H+ antiporter MnhE subunit